MIKNDILQHKCEKYVYAPICLIRPMAVCQCSATVSKDNITPLNGSFVTSTCTVTAIGRDPGREL